MRKKIFTFLLALAASVGMSWAETVVVINKSEFTSSGVTKEGVTLALSSGSMTSSETLAMEGSFEFSTSLGKFTGITIETDINIVEIYEGAFTSAGWPTGDNLGTSAVWTGESETVLISCMVAGNTITITCTIEPASVDPDPAGPIPCTAADRGKVLCTDGSIYATVSEATAASKTAAAVIAYVDTENGKALALALANESGTMDWETAKTTAAAHTPAVSGGTWTLASKDDWDHMINAAGGYNALRDGFSGVGGTNIQKGQYWTSTEYDSGISIVLNFGTNDGGYFVAMYEDAYNVRACLAFDIPAAVNITPNVDPHNAGVYYSTFYDSSNKYELPSGVEAFVADLSGSDLVLTKIAGAGQVIPADNAVILKANSDNITLTQTNEEAVSFSANNDLEGVDAVTTLASLSIDADECYVLSGTNTYGVGFYKIDGSSLKANKAYVIYDGEPSGAPRRLRFVFDQATSMENVQGDKAQSTKVVEDGVLYIINNGVKYNAQGQIVK